MSPVERLGHGSITTTARYLHTVHNADETALAALDKVRQRPAPKDSVAAEPSNANGFKGAGHQFVVRLGDSDRSWQRGGAQ